MSNPYPPNYGSSDPYGASSNYNPYQPQPDYQQQTGYSQPYDQPLAPGYGQPPYAQPVYVQPILVAQPQTNNKALASLILGICSYVLGLGPLTGVVAIILGHMALGEINRSGGTQSGRGMAIAGLVLGYVATIGTLIACLIIGLLILGAASTTTQ